MLRAFVVLMFAFLGVGAYVLLTGGSAAETGAPAAAASSSSGQLGFALAAGSIALFAAFVISRPRGRFRR